MSRYVPAVLLSRSYPFRIPGEPGFDHLLAVGRLIGITPVGLGGHRGDVGVSSVANRFVPGDETAAEMRRMRAAASRITQVKRAASPTRDRDTRRTRRRRSCADNSSDTSGSPKGSTRRSPTSRSERRGGVCVSPTAPRASAAIPARAHESPHHSDQRDPPSGGPRNGRRPSDMERSLPNAAERRRGAPRSARQRCGSALHTVSVV